MRMLDLCCGRFGWGRAFAARGWTVVGVDLTRPSEIPPGCHFSLGDVLTIGTDGNGEIHMDGEWSEQFDFICASSPCEEFSIHRMKMFHPMPKHPEMGIRLFNHVRSICEASGAPYVMENVQSAEAFVGRAKAHAGSFYLWGNGVPPLLPKGLTKGMIMDRKWCQELGGHGSSKRNSQTAGFATIPPELASCVADYAERIVTSELAAD